MDDNNKNSQYSENSEIITNLLKENAKLAKYYNIDFDLVKKIRLPGGAIKNTRDTMENNHLYDIVIGEALRSNIAYSFQLLDYFNYIFCSFSFVGPIETMLYKHACIIAVTILEAMIVEAATNVHNYCLKCHKNKDCKNFITNNDKKSMKDAARKLSEMGVASFSKDVKLDLSYFYDDRNHIHISAAPINEHTLGEFDEDTYMELITLLNTVVNGLNSEVVPYYHKCYGFIPK